MLFQSEFSLLCSLLHSEERVNVLWHQGQAQAAGEVLPQARGVVGVWSVEVVWEAVEEHVGGLPLGVTAAAVRLAKPSQRVMPTETSVHDLRPIALVLRHTTDRK